MKAVNVDGGGGADIGGVEYGLYAYDHEHLAKNRHIWQIVVNRVESLDERTYLKKEILE